MKPQIFELAITVGPEHIDTQNHVNNLVYLQWCLEAAEKHWTRNASTKHLENYVWYVVKHEISYKAPAFEGEEVVVKTWVESNEGVRSERRYEIWNPQQNKKLVEAKTLWCLLLAKTQRPHPIPEEICKLFTDE